MAPASCGGGSALEVQFLDLLNQTRARANLPGLRWNGCIADGARAWSGTMSTSSLHHNPNLAGVISATVPGWTAAAENIGVGGSVGSIDQALDASPDHYKNIVGPYDQVGVGVVVDASGQIWVTFDFSNN